jgi:hypothetical protein
MFSASKSGKLPGTPDPQFNYVTALLHGDGTNGAQNNTFLDSSSNNFTVTRGNTPTQGSFSPYGSLWSNYFNGSSYLTTTMTSQTFGTGDFTVEFWINPSSVGLSDIIDTRSAGDSVNAYSVQFDGTNLNWSNNGNYLSVPVSYFPIGSWTHVAYTRASGTMKVFVNGTQYGSSITLTNDYTNTRFDIGIAVRVYYYTGYISNLRVVKGSAVYTSNFTPSTTPLTAVTNTQLLTCQSNRFIDNSTNGFAVTPSGTPSIQRFNPFLPTYSQAYSTSVYGGSAYFNGTADYLTLPSNAAFAFGLSNFTLEAWVYLTSFNAYNEIIASRPTNGSNTSDLYSFGVDNTGSIFMFSASFLVQSSASAIKLNTWTHVALVRSGVGAGQTAIYVNGTSTATGIVANNLTGSTCSIGGLGNGTEPFYGYISDARVVNGTAVYTSTFTPPTAPLTAISGTSYLGSMTNGAIYDNAMMNDLITVGSAQISTSVKKYGTGSLSFNASTSYLQGQTIPSNSVGLGNFTIEGWIYLTTTGAQQMVIDTRSSGGSAGWFVYISTGNLIVWSGLSSDIRTSALSASTWYHFAICRTSTGTNGVTIYLNGVSQAQGTFNESYTQTTLVLGKDIPYGGFYLGGYLDDVRITKGYARYTSNFTPPTTALPNYGS